MRIDAIVNGFVIDHIHAGKSMELYRALKRAGIHVRVESNER